MWLPGTFFFILNTVWIIQFRRLQGLFHTGMCSSSEQLSDEWDKGQLSILPPCLSACCQHLLHCYQDYCTLIFSCPLYSTFLVLCVLCYHRDRRCSRAPGREWKQGFELTVPAGKKSPRQESIAVNGRRELCGPICLCVHGVLESTDAAKEALKMSCLQKAIFQRSQCSLEFRRNQTGYFICTKITEVTLTYSFC